MNKWAYGCGADDCKYPTYDIFDEHTNVTIARGVTYENASAIVQSHNALMTAFDGSGDANGE